MPILGKEGGKLKQGKAPKKEEKVMDETDVEFKAKQRAEQAKMKEMAAKL